MLPIRQQYKKPHPLSQLLQALKCSPRALKTTPFLEALFEHLPMAAAIVDEHDRIVSINPAFTALFGFSAEEALGKPIGELIVPEELRAEGKHFTEVALHGEPISTETVRKHREGERIPVWIRAVPIRLSGQHLGVLALYHDIRPLHQHRQRLVQLARSSNSSTPQKTVCWQSSPTISALPWQQLKDYWGLSWRRLTPRKPSPNM